MKKKIKFQSSSVFFYVFYNTPTTLPEYREILNAGIKPNRIFLLSKSDQMELSLEEQAGVIEND